MEDDTPEPYSPHDFACLTPSCEENRWRKMRDAQLADVYGDMPVPTLLAELFFMIRGWMNKYDAGEMARMIYTHIAENVMRKTDLDCYNEHNKDG